MTFELNLPILWLWLGFFFSMTVIAIGQHTFFVHNTEYIIKKCQKQYFRETSMTEEKVLIRFTQYFRQDVSFHTVTVLCG